MEKRVIILRSCSDYWEACYVDGKCVDQAHHLGEGYGKVHFLQELGKTHGITLDDIVSIEALEIDDNKAMDSGAFPQLFEELEGEYIIN